jgi:hypothetical protein
MTPADPPALTGLGARVRVFRFQSGENFGSGISHS